MSGHSVEVRPLSDALIASAPKGDGFLLDSWWGEACGLRSDMNFLLLPEAHSMIPDLACSPIAFSARAERDRGDHDSIPAIAGSGAGTPSPFGRIACQFEVLDGDGRLMVNGFEVEGLPDQLLSLSEVRSRLLNPSTSYAARDAALNWLTERTRVAGGDWTVALAGMLLPGLRASLSGIQRRHPRRRRDVESEALSGLWVAAVNPQAGRDKVASRLIWAARKAVDCYLRAERAKFPTEAQPLVDVSLRPAQPSDPLRGGHPDLVLAAAVHAGVLLAEDAELIGATRLEGVSLETAASQMGIAYAAVVKRRARAEPRLVAWIRLQQLDAGNSAAAAAFVPTGPAARGCSIAGRPRQGQWSQSKSPREAARR